MLRRPANAATANATRRDAAIAARDIDAFGTLLADDMEGVHPSGALYDRTRMLATYRRLLRAQGLTHRLEPLATLGDGLALLRLSALMKSCPEIQEVDINPLKVLRRGVCALDARIRVERPRQARSRRISY